MEDELGFVVDPARFYGSSDALDVFLHVVPEEMSGFSVSGAVVASRISSRTSRVGTSDERIGVGIVEERLDGGEDGGDIVGGTPAVLEDVETEISVGVDVGMDHFGEKLDRGRVVGVRLFKGEDETEGAVFKGRIGWDGTSQRIWLGTKGTEGEYRGRR